MKKLRSLRVPNNSAIRKKRYLWLGISLIFLVTTYNLQLTTRLGAEPLELKKDRLRDAAYFRSNQRITDVAKRSFWAHTFSSGAHSISVWKNNVYTTWYDVRNNDSDVFFAKSMDGGKTFGKNIQVNDDNGKSRQYKPSLGVDKDGVIYMAWRDDRRGHADIFFSRSKNQGKRFSKNRRLNDDSGWAYQGNPSLGVSPDGRVYAAWSDNRNEQDDIYFTASQNRGRRFRHNLKLNDDETETVQSHPTIGAGPEGLVLVAWEDFRNGRSEIFMTRSTDGGKTFEPNHSLASKFFPSMPTISPASSAQNPTSKSIQVSPSISVNSKGWIALAWAQFSQDGMNLAPPDAARGETLWWDKVRQNDADIYVSLSLDGGINFGAPVRVNDDKSNNSQSFPSVAIDSQGALFLSWEDFRNGQSDIFFAKLKIDAANTRNPRALRKAENQKVNDDKAAAVQSHPSLAVDDKGKMFFLWTDGRDSAFVSHEEGDEQGNDVYFTVREVGN